MYRAEPITASEIARRPGISTNRVLAALHREMVDIDPARQAAAVRAASARRRGTVPSLPADQAELAVRYYQGEGWSYRMIGEQLGVSAAKVRAELRRPRFPGPPPPARRPREPRRPNRGAGRQGARGYVESEWSAADVAAQLTSGSRAQHHRRSAAAPTTRLNR